MKAWHPEEKEVVRFPKDSHRPKARPRSGSLPAWRRPHRHRDRRLSHRRAGLEQSRGDPGDDRGRFRISPGMGQSAPVDPEIRHRTASRGRPALPASRKRPIKPSTIADRGSRVAGSPWHEEMIPTVRCSRHDPATEAGSGGILMERHLTMRAALLPLWLAAPGFPERVRLHPV